MPFKFNPITGKLDLVSDLTGVLTKSQADTYYLALDQTTPQTTIGTFTFPSVVASAFKLPTSPTAGYVLTSDNLGNSSWQPSPSAGNLVYYFTDTASSIAGYLQQTVLPYSPKTELDYTPGNGTNVLINFATNLGIPGLTYIPAGDYEFHIHAARASGTFTIYAEFIEVNSAGVYIRTIGTSESTATTTSEQEYRLYFTNSNVYVLTSVNSRIVARIWAITTSNPTCKLFVGGTADSHIALPSNTVDATNFVPYTGAIYDLDLGTHNLIANEITVTKSDLTPNIMAPNGADETGSGVTGGEGGITFLSGGLGGSATGTDSNPVYGGNGNWAFMGGGAGGNAQNDYGDASGGNGSFEGFESGAGGNAISATNAYGGYAGTIYLQAGYGGNATLESGANYGSATGGNGGDFSTAYNFGGDVDIGDGDNNSGYGGNAGNFYFSGGIGGAAFDEGGTNGVLYGGFGSIINFQSADGGSAYFSASGLAAYGGGAGDLNFIGGTGGNAIGGASNTGGDGADINFISGIQGAGDPGMGAVDGNTLFYDGYHNLLLKLYGDGSKKINIPYVPTGTLVSPPAGLNPGDIWADTTGGQTLNPILRIHQ